MVDRSDKNEIGRYKKKVEDQQKVIATLREVEQGYKEIRQVNNALMCVLLMALMATNESPYRIEREKVKKALQYGKVCATLTDDSKGYLIHYEMLK